MALPMDVIDTFISTTDAESIARTMRSASIQDSEIEDIVLGKLAGMYPSKYAAVMALLGY